MKRIVLAVAVALWGVLPAQAQKNNQETNNVKPMKNYAAEWKEADSLLQTGQPLSVQKIVDKIRDEAQREQNRPQFIKAIIYLLNAQGLREEEALVKGIAETEELLKTAPFPVQNILHTVAADLYWQYYRQNRWAFHSRTAAPDVANGDVRTYDLRRLVATCIAHYTASLASPQALQAIGIGEYAAILQQAEGSEKYRPTLFDFLAFRAVAFYQDNEAGLVQPADRFSIANNDYLLPAAAFAQLPLRTADSLSFAFQSLVLLQQILAFHLQDADPSALVDADLQRLDFVHRQSAAPGKDSAYLHALQALEAQAGAHPAAAEAAYRIAALYRQQGNAYDPFTHPAAQGKHREAVAVIDRATARFPDSFGAANGLALKNEIRQPHLEISTDEAVAPGQPVLVSVTYRNVPKVYFRLVALDFKHEMESGEDRPAAYAAKKAVQTAAFDLPDVGDYQQHTVELALPAWKEGYYALLASTDEHFSADAALLTENKVWATRISYLQKEEEEQDTILLLDRTTGQLLSGVSAQLYTREYSYDQRRYVVKYEATYTSDTAGRVVLKTAAAGRYQRPFLFFTKGTDSYAGGNVSLYRHSTAGVPPSYRTVFFTDRAIYRPGQTVYFKGLVLKWERDKAEITPHYRQQITFYNANGEKVAERETATNEFGSFAGSFVIPAAGLTGRMRIEATGANGSAYFNVEEYKRPKFAVTFDWGESEATYRLGEQIIVSGNAKSYAGSAVSDAKVTYRVLREARYPRWRWGWGPAPSSPAQEIISGETRTNADGSFEIAFTAIPDADADKAQSPVFHYSVTAAVSDLNGETHEAQTSVPIGYRALLLSTDIAGTVDLAQFKTIAIRAANLNGKDCPAQGTLAIWKLRDPDRVLQPRRGTRPDKFALAREEFEKLFPHSVYDDEYSADRREAEKQVFSAAFDTKQATTCTLPGANRWEAGMYRITLSAKDAYGETVADTATFMAIGQRATGNGAPPPAKSEVLFHVENPEAQPGETVKITAGSAYEDVQAVFEMTGHNGVVLEQRTLHFSNSTQRLEIPITEAHRGNVGVSLRFVKHNRSYRQEQVIQVPYHNKKLQLEWATFRDKLQPGAHEEWRITVKDAAGNAAVAELLASMYDASLDAFAPHQWSFFPWYNNQTASRWKTEQAFQFRQSEERITNYEQFPFRQRDYDRLIPVSMEPFYDYMPVVAYGGRAKKYSAAVANEAVVPELKAAVALAEEAAEDAAVAAPAPAPTAAAPPVVPLRTNFNETAFFYPQLKTNERGETVVSFTVPESLTRWKMQGLAWTPDLKIGYAQKELETQKELMIFPNAPRFFREGDTIYFSAKLTNLSGKEATVRTQLRFFDAFTMKEIPLIIEEVEAVKTTTLAAGGNSALAWKLYIPEGLQALTYRITATAHADAAEGGQREDGEENTLPVLTNRMLVTESLPLPIRGRQAKSYEFTKLLDARSATLRTHAYTIEFTSHPIWYAVQALPYLMEYPYECAEQAFARYYANTIAAHLAQSDPEIKRVFDLWRNYQPESLQSNLEKNGELKSLLLEETPWVRDARNESERKQRLAALFDSNRMSDEQAAALRKVQQTQTPNGGFAWFRGGRDDRYITQHIVAGIGHLQKMNIPTPAAETLLANAIRYMDARLAEELVEIKKQAAKEKKDYRKENHLSYLAAHYLYARSFFATVPVPRATREAFDYFKAQAAAYWPESNHYLKGMLALALHRYYDTKTARLILQSLSETALHSDEMGMYWRNENSGWWYQAPIEAQALMIEAFGEIANDRQTVADLQTWLLKQKQTQDWKTTKATADAIYALLYSRQGQSQSAVAVGSGGRQPAAVGATHALPVQSAGAAGSRSRQSQPAAIGATHALPLQNDEPYQITVGGEPLTPPSGDGGLYFKTSWHGSEVTPEMGRIVITPPSGDGGLDGGPAWGAAYWQYFEQLDKITPAATGVQIDKRLFIKVHSSAGDVLREITTAQPLRVGDKVVVRLEIRADRDMEYVHLKDMRAAAFEPVNVLSGYRWQDGLGYYEATRDAAVNFFISYLPKGTHVFEYELFATQQGEFSNGITTLQCMYAPEFSTHSEGARVEVR